MGQIFEAGGPFQVTGGPFGPPVNMLAEALMVMVICNRVSKDQNVRWVNSSNINMVSNTDDRWSWLQILLLNHIFSVRFQVVHLHMPAPAQ